VGPLLDPEAGPTWVMSTSNVPIKDTASSTTNPNSVSPALVQNGTSSVT